MKLLVIIYRDGTEFFSLNLSHVATPVELIAFHHCFISDVFDWLLQSENIRVN